MRSRILKVTLKRIFKNRRIYYSVLLLTEMMFFAVGAKKYFSVSVYNIFQHAVSSMGFMVTYIICAWPCADLFAEDLESGYVRYEIIRGGYIRYIVSAITSIILSSIFTMALGCLLFSASLASQYPWIDVASLEDSMAGLIGLWKNNTMWIWFLIWGLRMGMQAAILSVAAAAASLFITNKMLILSTPVLVYELFQEINVELYEKGIIFYNRSWFRLDVSGNGNDISMIITACCFTGICIGSMGILISRQLKRRL